MILKVIFNLENVPYRRGMDLRLDVEGDPRRNGFADDEWRALSTAGNDAFRRGDDREARPLYVLALEESERAWALAESGDEGAALLAPVLHTIACHNLAALERRAGDERASRALLERAFERLVVASHDASLPRVLRVRAYENVKPAVAEIVGSGAADDVLASVVGRAMGAWLSVRALHSTDS